MYQQSRSVFFGRAGVLVKLTTLDKGSVQRYEGSKHEQQAFVATSIKTSLDHWMSLCQDICWLLRYTPLLKRNTQHADLQNGPQKVPHKSCQIWICRSYLRTLANSQSPVTP